MTTLLAQVNPTISVAVGDTPWAWWAAIAIMVLLQLVILIVIAGRPSAVAVIGFTLPFLCGVCALVATDIILGYTRWNPELAGELIPLLYMIWAICGIVGLVTAILCIIPLRRNPPGTLPDLAPTTKPRLTEKHPEVPASPKEVKAIS